MWRAATDGSRRPDRLRIPTGRDDPDRARERQPDRDRRGRMGRASTRHAPSPASTPAGPRLDARIPVGGRPCRYRHRTRRRRLGHDPGAMTQPRPSRPPRRHRAADRRRVEPAPRHRAARWRTGAGGDADRPPPRRDPAGRPDRARLRRAARPGTARDTDRVRADRPPQRPVQRRQPDRPARGRRDRDRRHGRGGPRGRLGDPRRQRRHRARAGDPPPRRADGRAPPGSPVGSTARASARPRPGNRRRPGPPRGPSGGPDEDADERRWRPGPRGHEEDGQPAPRPPALTTPIGNVPR